MLSIMLREYHGCATQIAPLGRIHILTQENYTTVAGKIRIGRASCVRVNDNGQHSQVFARLRMLGNSDGRSCGQSTRESMR